MKKETVRVSFKGMDFWLLSSTGNGRALAPLEHCDANGHVIVLDVSFAHLYPDGRLIRFGQQIGTDKDLREVKVIVQ